MLCIFLYLFTYHWGSFLFLNRSFFFVFYSLTVFWLMLKDFHKSSVSVEVSLTHKSVLKNMINCIIPYRKKNVIIKIPFCLFHSIPVLVFCLFFYLPPQTYPTLSPKLDITPLLNGYNSHISSFVINLTLSSFLQVSGRTL